jgi:hypothetical protein
MLLLHVLQEPVVIPSGAQFAVVVIRKELIVHDQLEAMASLVATWLDVAWKMGCQHISLKFRWD